MTRSPADVAQSLDSSAAALATALYELDNAPDMVFVRAQADAGNAEAAGVVASLALAWERYSLLNEAVDRLEDAVAARRATDIDELLGPGAVHLPDGTTIAIAQLVEDVELRVEHVRPRVATMAGAARQALAALDAAQAAGGDIMARAAALAVADDVEITALRSALDRAVTAISADPTHATDLADLDRLVDNARARVEALEQHRVTVPAALDAATVQLERIEADVRRGTEALALTRAKIGPSPGLADPPDLTAGDRALRPWLDRIKAEASAGEWEAAAAGIGAWKNTADACLAEVARIADANAAPLARRNELRGLMQAYRAKAGALGRDEDGQLERLYTAARDVLYTAPCALDEAEARVQEYVTAVNATVGGIRR